MGGNGNEEEDSSEGEEEKNGGDKINRLIYGEEAEIILGKDKENKGGKSKRQLKREREAKRR